MVGLLMTGSVQDPASLQLSRRNGSGHRPSLRFLQHLKIHGGSKESFSAFPGAIIAVKGNYLDGQNLNVEEILEVRRVRANNRV